MGEVLQKGFVAFVDEKDLLFSLTPLYLLCGLSFPLWMPTSSLTLLTLMSGVITVGIGDTAASFFGSKWGSHKWMNAEKTIEGTIASVLSQVCVILALTCFGIVLFIYLSNIFYVLPITKLLIISIYLYFTGFVDSYWLLFRSILAAVVTSLIEARTDQIDNLALPMLMYICLII